MAVFEDKLYFGDYVTREIWSLDSLSGKPSQFTSSRPTPLYKNIKLYRLHDIQVNHPILQNTNQGKLLLAVSRKIFLFSF